MEPEAKTESAARQRTNRRRQPRYAVDEEATLLLLNLGAPLSCRILDLSLGGCRVRTAERFLAGVMIRVEVSFKVSGIPSRLMGVTQWTDRRNVVGIRFLDVSERKRDQLRQLMAELHDRELPAETPEVPQRRGEADRAAPC